MNQDFGLQLYSIRDITKDSMRMALEKVVAMGYTNVEFAGFFDYTAEQITIWLNKFGLRASGTHTGMDALRDENIEATIAYHKAIGCDHLIVPGADWKTEEKLNANIDLLNRAQKRLAENGIRLGYHNHSGEFLTTSYGKVIEEEIIRRTSVDLEIDTFWSFNAGLDNLALLERLKDRINTIHLKDGIPTPPEHRNYSEWHTGVVGKSVGSGCAPVREVCEWADKNGVTVVVESEGLDPTGLEEVGRCIEYLKTL